MESQCSTNWTAILKSNNSYSHTIKIKNFVLSKMHVELTKQNVHRVNDRSSLIKCEWQTDKHRMASLSLTDRHLDNKENVSTSISNRKVTTTATQRLCYYWVWYPGTCLGYFVVLYDWNTGEMLYNPKKWYWMLTHLTPNIKLASLLVIFFSKPPL